MDRKTKGDEVGGDKITVGDIQAEGSAIAIGREARAEVHYHYEIIERPEPSVPYLAPGLPPHHVPRLGELKRLVEALKPGAGAVAVTALRGMGGVGKTTLAIAACHDATVLERFPDGVLWATLGPSVDKADAESKVADAQQAWAEALAIYREVGERRREATTLDNIGIVHEARGESDEALARYEAALAIYREVGDRKGEAATLHNAGRVHSHRGQHDEALARYEAALAICREVEYRAGEAATLSNIGMVHEARGEPDEALARLEAALAIQREVGDRRGEAITASNLAKAHQKREALAEAVRLLEVAVAIEEQIGMPQVADDWAALEQVRAKLKAKSGG